MFQLLLTLHVLGACVWTGGHLVLAIGYLPRAVRTGDVAPLQAFETRFERIGIPALVAQVLTGFYLAHHYLPPSEWISFGSVVSSHVTVKLILLVATVLLATHARLRVIPRLDAGNVRFLAVHVVAVTVIAVLLVVVGVGIRTGGVF